MDAGIESWQGKNLVVLSVLSALVVNFPCFIR